MDKAIKISYLVAGAYAALRPSIYAFIFTFTGNLSASVSILVAASCIVIALSAFKNISTYLLTASVTVLVISSVIGFFYHFKDSGESGPLPYEWLNGYFIFTFPLMTLVLLGLLRNQWSTDA